MKINNSLKEASNFIEIISSKREDVSKRLIKNFKLDYFNSNLSDCWNECENFHEYMIVFKDAINDYFLVVYFFGEETKDKYAKKINTQFKENSLDFVGKIKDEFFLISAEKYFYSLGAFRLLVEDDFNASTFKLSSDICIKYIYKDKTYKKILKGKLPPTHGFLKTISKEFIRRLLIIDYDYIVSTYNTALKFDLLKSQTDSNINVLKFGYLLAKDKLDGKKENQYFIKSLLILIKYSWIQNLSENSYIEPNLIDLFLIQKLYANYLDIKDCEISSSVFEKLSPEEIEKELNVHMIAMEDRR